MDFKNCTIIIPVIRETDLLESVIKTILNTCNPLDLKEFIIVVHPEYTKKESFLSIEKMKKECENIAVSYKVIQQRLPGMGGAMRDALDIAQGTHTIIQSADIASDPVVKLIENEKQHPNDITIVSRHTQNSKIEKGYDKFKLIWNILSQKYCAILYHSKLTDFTFGYRICPTQYYKIVNWKELKHPFALEVTLKFLRLGIKFHEIPGNQAGGSQSGYAETLLYLPTSLKIRFMSKKKILKPGMLLDL